LRRVRAFRGARRIGLLGCHTPFTEWRNAEDSKRHRQRGGR
jgi:hypothetical protein